MSTSRGHSAAGALISVVIALSVLATASWMLLNRSYIVDQLAVWQYQPDAAIEQLVLESGMGDKGKFYFYASHPILHESQDAFNAACPRQEKASAILGCYASGQIHVYDVPDERLAAVPAVTAAHEMLHAAWDRLPESEREYIGELLQVEYSKLQSSADSDLESRMAYYERTSPSDINNELHAIIATETSDIAEELEAHYDQYFEDRQQVVEMYSSYNDQFADLSRSAETLKQELERTSVEIQQMVDQYNTSIDTLNDDILVFNARAAGMYYQDEASFSRDRDTLSQRADELEQLRTTIDVKANEYEQKRLVYNEQVDESNSLLQALDSTLAPAPSI